MVKVTGSQRIDLLGVKKADLPHVWRDLGMPSGQAYTKGVRMVKTCVGTEFCRFGVQDSTNAGIELERRLENLFTPHKFKMGVVGCPRNCAEATVKDLGLVGQEGSWQVVVGGAAGKSVRKADLLVTVETTEEALEAGELFFQYYRENGNYLERSYDFVERLGIEKIRKETVYAPEEEKRKLLDRLHRSKALAQRRVAGTRPPGECHAVCADRAHGKNRGGSTDMTGPGKWTKITRIENIPPREGRPVRIGNLEIAIFNLNGRFLTIENACPAQGRAAVRRNRHRNSGGLPAARATLRSRDRHAGSGVGTRLSGRVSDARGRRRCSGRSRRRRSSSGHGRGIAHGFAAALIFCDSPQRLRTYTIATRMQTSIRCAR